jgi:hypothetical protein
MLTNHPLFLCLLSILQAMYGKNILKVQVHIMVMVFLCLQEQPVFPSLFYGGSL